MDQKIFTILRIFFFVYLELIHGRIQRGWGTGGLDPTPGKSQVAIDFIRNMDPLREELFLEGGLYGPL